MEWWQLLIIILLSLFALMLMRIPVAFAFFTVNIVAAFYLWGFEKGTKQIVISMFDALTSFSIAPIPLFILMGEIMFVTRIAPKIIETLDLWLGKIPGRLSFLSVGGGTVLSTLSGSSVACIAMLGSSLVPDMESRGYKKPMTLGPIMASGTLAAMIPPSAIGVLLASIAQISVGSFLIAIILPGISLALIFAIYIFVRVKFQPELAPIYDSASIPLSEKLKATIKYVLPLGFIIFLVIGLIFLGFATPTEAAAMGVVGTIILAILFKGMSFAKLSESLVGTVKVTSMIFIVIAGSSTFSQILSFSGITKELVNTVSNLPFTPMTILVIMLVIAIFMGTFMDGLSILMIILPIFMPIATLFDFNLLWFAVLILITIEIGQISPPFGLGLFTMKGVAPPDTKMSDVYGAALPFIGLSILLIVVIIIFPGIATWLPSMIR